VQGELNTEVRLGDLREGHLLGYIGIDRRIILKWIFNM